MLILNATATAIKTHEASKEPWEGNLRPEAMASSVNKFCRKKSRRKIPAVELARRYNEKGNETPCTKSESEKMLEDIGTKGEVRDPQWLTSDNDIFASARLDEDGAVGGKDAHILNRNISSHYL